eukprot:349679-Chlamydomonas_euryale.AAC.5
MPAAVSNSQIAGLQPMPAAVSNGQITGVQPMQVSVSNGQTAARQRITHAAKSNGNSTGSTRQGQSARAGAEEQWRLDELMHMIKVVNKHKEARAANVMEHSMAGPNKPKDSEFYVEVGWSLGMHGMPMHACLHACLCAAHHCLQT